MQSPLLPPSSRATSSPGPASPTSSSCTTPPPFRRQDPRRSPLRNPRPTVPIPFHVEPARAPAPTCKRGQPPTAPLRIRPMRRPTTAPSPHLRPAAAEAPLSHLHKLCTSTRSTSRAPTRSTEVAVPGPPSPLTGGPHGASSATRPTSASTSIHSRPTLPPAQLPPPPSHFTKTQCGPTPTPADKHAAPQYLQAGTPTPGPPPFRKVAGPSTAPPAVHPRTASPFFARHGTTPPHLRCHRRTPRARILLRVLHCSSTVELHPWSPQLPRPPTTIPLRDNFRHLLTRRPSRNRRAPPLPPHNHATPTQNRDRPSTNEPRHRVAPEPMQAPSTRIRATTATVQLHARLAAPPSCRPHHTPRTHHFDTATSSRRQEPEASATFSVRPAGPSFPSRQPPTQAPSPSTRQPPTHLHRHFPPPLLRLSPLTFSPPLLFLVLSFTNLYCVLFFSFPSYK